MQQPPLRFFGIRATTYFQWFCIWTLYVMLSDISWIYYWPRGEMIMGVFVLIIYSYAAMLFFIQGWNYYSFHCSSNSFDRNGDYVQPELDFTEIQMYSHNYL